MTDSLFRSGTLELPLTPAEVAPMPTEWVDMGINRILMVATVLLVLLSLRGFVRVAPHIFQSLGRTRGCLALEHSFSMARLRDICALVMVVPFCLVSDRYGMLQFLFGWNLPQWAGSLAVLCVLAAYGLLRFVMFKLVRPRRMDYDYSNALTKSMFTLFIVLCTVMLISLPVFILLGLPDDLCRIVLFAEIAFFYIFSLVRSIQFLSAYCNAFATFLYLCALEFIPLAAVAATCMFLKM